MPFGIRWGSLRTKIIAWSFIPTMIILVIVAVVIFNAYQDVMEELVIERNQELTRLMSSQHEAALNEYVDLLDTETRMPDIYEGDPVAQRDALKGAGNRLAAFDGGTLILDTFGKVVTAEPERLEILGDDWSEHTYYLELLRLQMKGSSEPVFSDIVADGPNGSEVLCIAVPINGESGEFVGCIVGMFRLEVTTRSTFYANIWKLHGEESGSTYIIVDGSGSVIYHSETDHIGDDFSAQDIVQRVLSGQEDAIPTKDRDGHSIVASYASVPGTSWGLVIEENWNSVISSSHGHRNTLIGLLVLGIFVPTLIILFGVRRIMSPIEEVTDAAREIGSGNFSHRITCRTGDELEEMAGQFNTMAGALQESYSDLERKVEERTRGERRRADQLKAINDVGRSISTFLKLNELLPYVAESIRETFNYYGIYIFIVDRTTNSLILKTGAGGSNTLQLVGSSVGLSEGIIGSVVETGNALMVGDVTKESKYVFVGELADTKSELAVPIKIGEDVVGVLDVQESEIDAFDELDLFTTQTLADQLAVAIQNARLYEQAQEAATVEERQRLARDLHDAVTQTLFSASLIAEVLPRLWERKPEDGQKRLEELRQLTRGALAEMRMLLLELRPAALMEADLGDLLKQLTEAITAKSRIPIILNIEGERDVPPEVQIMLYRIAQESLNNIVKHSGAKQIDIKLDRDSDQVELQIIDDGIGFDTQNIPSDHLGLRIMRERVEAVNATIKIESQVDHGTKIVVVWADKQRKE